MKEQHKTFCELYLQHFNATKAYQEVYKDASYDTARANASALLKENEEIKEYLKNKLTELTITSNEVILGLAKIARDESQKTSDRIRAYELLGKTHGIFLDRTDITTQGERVSWNQFINAEDGKVKNTFKGTVVDK